MKARLRQDLDLITNFEITRWQHMQESISECYNAKFFWLCNPKTDMYWQMHNSFIYLWKIWYVSSVNSNLL